MKKKALISKEREKVLCELETRLGVSFKRKELLNQSLTHSSYVYESDCDLLENERLEFLGDSVLGLVVSDYIYKAFPSKNEGQLAKMRAVIVSGPVLAKKARELGLGECLLLGKGEEQSGGRNRESILSDAYEAVVGAIFLDLGFEKAREFVLRHFKDEIEDVHKNKYVRDAKTLLQEYTQSKYKVLPQYKIESIEGPDHKQTFKVSVAIKERFFGFGTGRSKKEAEQNAAFEAFRLIKGGKIG